MIIVQLYNILNENSRCFAESTDEQKIWWSIMTNENEKVMIDLAKFVFNAMK